ncbi:MAG: hypothetical protein NVS1B1_13870 [Candidatus Limnocylindrales bacterium]
MAGRMPSVSFGLYALLTGVALGLTTFVWHVYSDNAFLYLYFIALLLLMTGSIAALLSLARAWGLPKAIGALVLAAGVSFALFGVLGLTDVLAGPIVAEGNGSQSPCIAEARARNPGGAAAEPPGYRPPGSAEVETSSRRGVGGGLAQFLMPFLSGLIPLALAIRGRPPGNAVLIRGLAPAAAVTAYVYLRGPGAWCGQLIGLDGLIVVVLGVLWSLGQLHLPGPREVPEQAV